MITLTVFPINFASVSVALGRRENTDGEMDKRKNKNKHEDIYSSFVPMNVILQMKTNKIFNKIMALREELI